MLLNKKYLIYEHVEEPEPNQVIWRYMNLEKLLDLIISESLFFCRVDKLADKAEGTIPPKNVEEIYADIKKWDIRPTKSLGNSFVEQSRQNVMSFRQFTLVNCWSMNNEESFALWKIYLGGNKYGVAIQSTYQRFKDCIGESVYDVLLGKVKYGDKSSSITQSRLFLLKSKYYEYESEIRALIFNQFRTEVKNLTPIFDIGLKIGVDLNKLIESIYISPLAPDWFFELVTKLITEYFPLKVRNEIKINKSRINQKL